MGNPPEGWKFFGYCLGGDPPEEQNIFGHKILEEFKELCGKALERQFNEKRDKWRLRMSEVGKPLCQQKLKKKGIKQEYE